MSAPGSATSRAIKALQSAGLRALTVRRLSRGGVPGGGRARRGVHAGAGGGGIYLDSGTVTLHDSTVTGNVPDNCAPPGAVAGCTGSQQRAAQDR